MGRIRDTLEKLIGFPLPSTEYGERQLKNWQALAILSPDSLSSIAYANEEIFLGLVAAGAAGLAMSFQLGVVISAILAILTVSYYQTIHGYPSGGGSWIVARENLGKHAGLIAAAALMLDYLLVAAVSLTAGVQAIASAFPFLWPHRIVISIMILVVIAIINLRGTREAGNTISIPVYFFLLTYIPMLGYGFVRAFLDGPGNLAAVAPPAIEPLSLVLILHAFATGCTALTGVEAISNAVPVFEEPKSKNAGNTLIVMSVLVGALFLGSIYLTQYFAVIPGENETILSGLARRILGDGPLYVIIQLATLIILAVAANTSFADFPRVAALLARDSYIARQLSDLGDRLVFSNGILLLSGLTAVLIVMFGGEAHALIPLFAIGAFLAFTLSQAGMVVHWWRLRGVHWELKALINGVGAIVTGTALCIIGYSKFGEGAWITLIVIPGLVLLFLRIHQHYEAFDKEMATDNVSSPISWSYLTSLQRAAVPVSRINKGTVDAIGFARLVAKRVMAVHVELVEGSGAALKEEWELLYPTVPLHIVKSQYRSISEPLIEFLEAIDDSVDDGQLTAVVLPAFVTAEWWQNLLHNQTTWRIRQAVTDRNRELGKNRTIVEVPFLLDK